MNCKYCSAAILEQAKFCTSCGHPVHMNQNLNGSQSNATIIGQIQQINGYQYVYVYGGLGKRILAYIIDQLVIFLFFLIIIVVSSIFGFLGVLLSTISLIAVPGYLVWAEQSEHRGSIGKKIVGITITQQQGESINVLQAIVRVFIKYFFPIGFLTAIFTDKQQALHDLATQSLVVEKKEVKPSLTQVVGEILDDIPFGELSRNVKAGLSNLPGITIVSDAIMGLSGVQKQMDYLKEEPYEAINWLQYFECYVTYKKMNSGISWFRLITNPMGFAISKGVSVGLNVTDDQHNEFEPLNCVKKALILSMEKINSSNYKAVDIAILAKAQFYIGINTEDQFSATQSTIKAIQYMSQAIQLEKIERLKGEYFFYLSQYYAHVNNRDLRMKSLNLSRKFGFEPALTIIKQELQIAGMEEIHIEEIDIPLGVTRINTFRITYKPSFEKKIENMIDGVVKGQSEKFKKTANKIKNMME